jgi:hypothetical protein
VSDTRRIGTPQEQVARAISCCGDVAKLYKRYGGPFTAFRNAGSHPLPVTGDPVKAPRSGYQVKRTMKEWR